MKTNLKLALKKAFSLIELLVVIAVIGILAAVAIPVMTGVKDAATSAKADYNAGVTNTNTELAAYGSAITSTTVSFTTK